MKVGAARRRVIAWESGENLPSLHYLRAIAHATDASVDELAGTDSDDEEAAQVAAATNDFIAAIDRMLQERLELLLRDKVTA